MTPDAMDTPVPRLDLERFVDDLAEFVGFRTSTLIKPPHSDRPALLADGHVEVVPAAAAAVAAGEGGHASRPWLGSPTRSTPSWRWPATSRPPSRHTHR